MNIRHQLLHQNLSMSPEGSPDSPTWCQRSTHLEDELWSWSSGLAYNPLPFKEKDVSSSPKFTAPLVDRSVVAGYATAISCAVRGHPKVGNIPLISWLCFQPR